MDGTDGQDVWSAGMDVMDGRTGQTDGWMDGRDRRMGRTDGQTDRTDGQDGHLKNFEIVSMATD